MTQLRWLELLSAVLVFILGRPVSANEPQLPPAEHPDRAILQGWADRDRHGPAAPVDPGLAAAASTTGSVNLLDHLQYTPAERDQGSCENGWVWAGTGVLEIALSVQNGVDRRLSEQFLSSCRIGPSACCGGWLSDLVDFYRPDNSYVVPWANSGADWRDGDCTCVDGDCVCEGGRSPQACDLIDTSEKVPISSIQKVLIPTWSVTSDQAIANIKEVLDQSKAVSFSFSLPNRADWDAFDTFWSERDESDVWSPDRCGEEADQGQRGHVVLCVGYDDTDPGNRYWLMLNSRGAPLERPHGLFRVSMDLPYDCAYTSQSQTMHQFYWETLNVTFDAGDPAVSNDEFDEALVIPQAPYQHSQSTAGASTAATDPVIGCMDPAEQGGRTVWFRYTPAFSGQLNVDTHGSSYDTVLALWTGAEGTLQPVACNDNSSGGLQSALQASVVAGAVYFIEVVDRDVSQQTGELKLSLSLEPDWQSCLPLILKDH